jgi:hypothetical protein
LFPIGSMHGVGHPIVLWLQATLSAAGVECREEEEVR